MMYVVYSVVDLEYIGRRNAFRVVRGGLFAVSSSFTIYKSRKSDCEWLIPGTWQED